MDRWTPSQHLSPAVLLLGLLLGPGNLAATPEPPTYQPRNGDLVFHTSRSAQSQAIQIATRSPWSHVGVIYLEAGEALVFEAVQPVRITPLEDWARRGEGGRFVAKRLRDADRLLPPTALAEMKRIGEAWLGRDYDLAFAWSDRRLYCSELVWKLFRRGAGIELTALESLGGFDLQHPLVAEAIRRRWGEAPPDDEPVVSPAALFASSWLEAVWVE